MEKEENKTGRVPETEFSRTLREKHLPEIGALIGKTLTPEMCGLEVKTDKGSFRCDNYIKTSDGKAVIIENQYDNSDHDHLGKLFTYATMLTQPECPVTDVVWVLIEGSVHIEHFNALQFINRLCEENGIEFKMWLFIAELEGKEYTFRETKVDDIWERGEGKPLHPFMEQLREAIVRNGYNQPNKSGTKCLGISHCGKDYSLNIPFREKWLKVEALFNHNNARYMNIEANFDRDIEDWCEENDLFLQIADDLNFVHATTGTYYKIGGSFPGSIDNEAHWDEYITNALSLLEKINSFADFLAKRYG